MNRYDIAKGKKPRRRKAKPTTADISMVAVPASETAYPDSYFRVSEMMTPENSRATWTTNFTPPTRTHIPPAMPVAEELGRMQDGIIEMLETAMALQLRAVAHLEPNYHYIQLAKDFLTIRMGLGRRMGNTTLARRMMERHPDSYCIVANGNMVQHAVDIGIPRNRLRSINQLNQHGLRGTRVGLCVVDGASVMSLDRLYEEVHADFYILLG